MLWLCLQFPSLPLQALTRAQTSTAHNNPQAVIEQQWIVAANTQAMQCGIESDLAVATARKRCPKLQLLTRDNHREKELLQELAQWAYSFTPVVSLQPSAPIRNSDSRPACLYLELSGCLRASGGLQALLKQLRQELGQMQVTTSMGLGHSPSAARMLSQLPQHQQWLTEAQSLPTAQLWRQWIHCCPSKLLDCDNETIASLYACGITRVGQLLALPLSEVSSRFGREFVDYLARLNGGRQDPLPRYQPPQQLHCALVFPTPLETSEQLLFPAARLVRALCRQLQRRQLYVQYLYWKVDFGKNGCRVVSVDLSQPLFDPQRLLALTKIQLQSLQIEHQVHALHLTCGQWQLLQESVKGLGELPADSKLQSSHQLLGKLKARLGREAISGVTLH
ncbi:DNA polymerase IV [Microbulbifer aestuariivivens]|uniref:DNA polymerase IV n=1 Tax=Microbulbifer aestuariivivens TaxID=1908308 RepID=A0ABP9WSC7_9GAMM